MQDGRSGAGRLCGGQEQDAEGRNEIREHRKRILSGRNRDIDIIKLNGCIELAPILGLSDVIVDMVETGTTLKENDLKWSRQCADKRASDRQ